VKIPNPETDRRRERRMVLHDQWQWLRASKLAGPERYGMTVYEATKASWSTSIACGIPAERGWRELERKKNAVVTSRRHKHHRSLRAMRRDDSPSVARAKENKLWP